MQDIRLQLELCIHLELAKVFCYSELPETSTPVLCLYQSSIKSAGI